MTTPTQPSQPFAATVAPPPAAPSFSDEDLGPKRTWARDFAALTALNLGPLALILVCLGMDEKTFIGMTVLGGYLGAILGGALAGGLARAAWRLPPAPRALVLVLDGAGIGVSALLFAALLGAPFATQASGSYAVVVAAAIAIGCGIGTAFLLALQLPWLASAYASRRAHAEPVVPVVGLALGLGIGLAVLGVVLMNS